MIVNNINKKIPQLLKSLNTYNHDKRRMKTTKMSTAITGY